MSSPSTKTRKTGKKGPPTQGQVVAAQSQLIINFGPVPRPGPQLVPFSLIFPNIELQQVLEAGSMTKVQLLRQMESILGEELHDPFLHVVNISAGSIKLDCMTSNLSETVYSSLENGLMSRALGEPQKLSISLPFGPGGCYLEYDDPALMEEVMQKILPKPERLALSAPPMQTPLLEQPRQKRTKEQVAAEIELLLGKCILGKPLRTEDETAFDDNMNEAPSIHLYWYPLPNDTKKRRIGIIVTDEDTRIVCPDVPAGTSLNNQAPNFATQLTSLLKDYL